MSATHLLHRLRLAAVGAIALTTSLFVFAAPAAHASTTVTVQMGVCSTAYRVPSDGLYFKLGSHRAMKLRLTAVYSWAWKRDIRGFTTPSTAKNQYHVRFYDGAGTLVWKQSNSIPNGGSRDYYLGSNVRKIKITSGIGLDAYGRPYQWAVLPAVGYTS